MSFKKNILKKIMIKKLAKQALNSLIPKNGIQGVDKNIIRKLLAIGNYKQEKVRDLELYIIRDSVILVLDNGLTIYNSNIKDIVMRKSPTVKEMVNFRNIIKILNDSDIIISKKQGTVDFIRDNLIKNLDLSFTQTDIDEIRLEGMACLESGYNDGIIEILHIFAEILNYTRNPAKVDIPHCEIMGQTEKNTLCPVVVFSKINNKLYLIKERINLSDPEQTDIINKTVSGKTKADVSGSEVFTFLKSEVCN